MQEFANAKVPFLLLLFFLLSLRSLSVFIALNEHMKSRSLIKDHGYWSGSETSTQAKLRSWQYTWLAWSFPPAALGKAYEHHVGKALHSAAYL